MQNVNWNEKQIIARRMSTDELRYAIADCLETARIMGDADMYGKDGNYYRDEASVYRAELARREAKASKAANRAEVLGRWHRADDDATMTLTYNTRHGRAKVMIEDSEGSLALSNWSSHNNGADIFEQVGRLLAAADWTPKP